MAYNKHMGYKYMTLGEDTYVHDFKAYGDTTSKYIFWDASADSFYIAGTLYLNGTAITATAAEINSVADASARVVNCTAATLTLDPATHGNKVVTLNKADGIAITLPAATGSGVKYTLVVGTTITSGAITITTTSVYAGSAILTNGATVDAYNPGASDEIITMNGSTQGGLLGAKCELIDAASGVWTVHYTSGSSGTEATPFSSAS